MMILCGVEERMRCAVRFGRRAHYPRSPEMIRNTEAKRQAKHLRDAEEAARRALEGTALIGHLHRRFCKILLILANLNIVQIWQKFGNFADFARK